MITLAYVRQMASYNAWQNKQLFAIITRMSANELSQDRGAFFGSIIGTLSHLLWGDMLWLNRFDPNMPIPKGDPRQSAQIFADMGQWKEPRVKTDEGILHWAHCVTLEDLQGDISFYSKAMEQTFSQPTALCVAGFFNHQTHHRGQVHAMLTAAGHAAPVSDLIFIPEDE